MTDEKEFIVPIDDLMRYCKTTNQRTGSCFRCGSPEGKVKTIWNNTYCVCKHCGRRAEGAAEEVANLYLFGKCDYIIGFRAEDIPELKRVFAQSESEDIRKAVKFLEGVEADIHSKEEEG